jgi:hypothetical protein
VFTLIRLLFLPVRVGLGSSMFRARLGYRAGRILGYKRVLLIAIGIGIGLLIAPVPGAELRRRLRQEFEDRISGGGDLAERVRYELSHSPRTWHLPQPDVEVIGGTAILRGEVPHEVGRADLERTAAAVAGIVHVENQVDVAGTNGQH